MLTCLLKQWEVCLRFKASLGYIVYQASHSYIAIPTFKPKKGYIHVGAGLYHQFGRAQKNDQLRLHSKVNVSLGYMLASTLTTKYLTFFLHFGFI